MDKRSSSRLMVKVLTGLMLFVFLIMFVFILPQASSAAQIADNPIELSTTGDTSSISPSSVTIGSDNNVIITVVANETISPITIEETPEAVFIKAVAATKPATTPVNTVPQTKAVNSVTPVAPLSLNKSVTFPIPKAVTKADSILVAKPVTSPVTKPITKPIIKPTTQPVAKVTKPLTKPVTIPETKPVTIPATKPVTIPATKPVTKPVTIPETKPVTIPATKPVTTPVTKPAITQPPITAPAVTQPAEVYYRVTYVIDGETVKAEKVLKNSAGKPPTIPEKPGYSCNGWNKSVAKVVSDLTVTAVYTKISVTMPAGADEVFYVKTSSGTEKVYGTIDEADSKAAFNLVNNYRVSKGIPALKWDDRYFQAAKQRAAECMLKFSHTRPNGSNCTTVDTGIRITGENLAMGYGSPSRFFDAMKNSSGHNDNLLRSSYKLSAIAVYKFDGYVFWAEMFGY